MIFRDFLVFATIQLGMVLFACAEAYMEGKDGWKWNPKWWRINLPGGYTYTAYHFFIYFGMFPILLIFLPLLIAGWDRHLFLVLLFSYVVGSRVEDFTWFVVNPLHPLSKWNPQETRWYPWITVGKLSIPLSYTFNFIVAVGILIVLLKGY